MKRYDWAVYDGKAVMERSDSGEWVRHEDATKRIAELEKKLKRFVRDFGNEYPAETRRAAQIIAKAKGR